MGNFLITQVAESVPFDNDTNGFIADDVQAAIEESKQIAVAKKHIITMGYNATCTNVWLRFHDNVNSNQSKWATPVRLHVLKVFFSNKNSGSSSNHLEMKITAYQKAFSSTGNISTSDSKAWWVEGQASNTEYWSQNGRMWIYNNSTEGDYMDVGYSYAFRLERTNGSTFPNDATVWVYCEEA